MKFVISMWDVFAWFQIWTVRPLPLLVTLIGKVYILRLFFNLILKSIVNYLFVIYYIFKDAPIYFWTFCIFVYLLDRHKFIV